MSKEKPAQHVALVDGNNVATVPFRRWMDTIDKLADATSTTATAAVAAVAAIPAATPQTLIYPSDTIDVFGAPSSGYTLGVRASALGSSSAAPTFIFMDGDSGDGPMMVPGPTGNTGLAGAAGTTIGKGAANPGAPALNDLFYRTDLGLLIQYDGTRWLTVNEYEIEIAANNLLTNTSDPAGFATTRRDFGVYLTRFTCTTRVLTTNTGANFWSVALQWISSTVVLTTLVTVSTAADAPDTIVDHSSNINAVLNANAFQLTAIGTKTGAPGQINVPSVVHYRLIVT